MGIRKAYEVPQERKRILLIEDDPSLRHVLKLFLESEEGYFVDCVSNGQEALDYLGKHERPSLILLNLEMPIMDGFQFAAQQKQNPKIADIPVVLSSAADPYFELTYLVRTGARALWNRKGGLNELAATIRRYCS